MQESGTTKATVAGVLDIVAGSMALVGGMMLIGLGAIGSGILASVPEDAHGVLKLLPLLVFYPLALLVFAQGAVAIAGGIAALNRRSFGLAVAGSIIAVLLFFPLGVVALILTILAEPEFRSAAIPVA
jgi:hypothetical protein